MTDDSTSRRSFLAGAGATALAALAGCTETAGVGPLTVTEGTTTETPAAGTDGRATAYTRVYREAVGSVVAIRALGAEPSQGSGFVHGATGRVVTNQHVIEDATEIEIRFSRGEWRGATVRGADAYSDLAVLSVERPPAYATPLPFAAREPVIGQQVVAIGTPFGLERSLSAGVVSGVNRTISTEGGFTIPDAVQTDAALNPGNSGGPLLSLAGEVLGVVRSGGGENIGFAISADLAERVLPALVEDGEYDHPYMGVELATVSPTIAEANNLADPQGVLVVSVLEGGPADGVLRPSQGTRIVEGIRVPAGGDVIGGIDGESIASAGDLSNYLALETRPGRTVSVEVLRNGARRSVELRVGERPEPRGV